MSVDKREDERGRIYHEAPKRDEKADEKNKKHSEDESAKKSVEKEEANRNRDTKETRRDYSSPVPEDDDSWGAIPAFLRRHKK